MNGEMANKVALVTGGGSGIGRATAQAFGRRGARVAVVDVDAGGGQHTVRRIEEAGGHALFIACDVANRADVQSMVTKVVETYGGLDYAFNNAGIAGEGKPISDSSEEAWDRVLNVNLRGVWLCMQQEIPEMLKRGKGAIVNTSSTAGMVAAPYVTSYAASKWGVVGLTKTVALEFAKFGIRINSVSPGVIRTEMVNRAIEDHPEMVAYWEKVQPIGRYAEPDELAQTVVFLCSDATSFITGVNLPFDGGWTAHSAH
jgi:NAD(P)-dependent dehydrogenase (short-subunit alcohol dehydrogenase family)